MAKSQKKLMSVSRFTHRRRYNALYIGAAMLIMNATDLLSVLYIAK